MFTATSFITAPTRRQPRCPSAGARLDTLWPAHTRSTADNRKDTQPTRNNLEESPEDAAEWGIQPKGHIRYTYLHAGSPGQGRLELRGSLRHRFLSLNAYCPLHTPRPAEDTEGRPPITWVFDGSSSQHPTCAVQGSTFKGS